MNIFASINSNQEKIIIKNEDALTPDFFPPEFLHRESEKKEVAITLNSIIESKAPESAFIFGPTGTGKTSIAKNLLQQLKEYSSKTICVYANCWQSNTKQAILSKIAEEMKLVLPRRGISNDEFKESIIEAAQRDKKVIAIILDEIDVLFSNKSEDVLYELSRNKEMHSVPTTIIGISNSKELFVKIDIRLKSSLQMKKIEFKQYSPAQLKDILIQRAKIALKDGTFDEEIISLCAVQGAKRGGDARVAISILSKSAKIAQKENSAKILPNHVKKVVEEEVKTQSKEKDENLSELEEKIIQLLKEDGKTAATAIYEKMQKQTEYKERSIRTALSKLQERKKVICEVEEKKGKFHYYQLA
jgi:cell division control protein 6